MSFSQVSTIHYYVEEGPLTVSLIVIDGHSRIPFLRLFKIILKCRHHRSISSILFLVSSTNTKALNDDSIFLP